MKYPGGIFRLVSTLAIFISLAAAAQPAETPEEVIRSLLKAIYANDIATYEKLTVPDPRRQWLTTGGRVNERGLRELQEDPESVQIRMKRGFTHRGRPVEPGKDGYPVGTTSLFMVAHGGGPMMVTLTKRAEGWKVDLRWWLAMVELSSVKAPPRGSASSAARSLIGSLVALDRKQAVRFATPSANLDMLFAGAPSQREPSGHLEALTIEMPIVEVGAGEFYEFPSGRIVEGTQREDMKVLVGLMGSVEIPFVLRRIGTEWRVEPEPYFMLIMR